MRGYRYSLLFALPLLAVLLAPVRAAEPEATSDQAAVAVWKLQSLDFWYHGFTTQYSCSGLRDQLRQILLKLGARTDLKLSDVNCGIDSSRPTPNPTLHIEMSVLAPASGGVGESTVAAHWRKASIHDIGGQNLGADCELMEQVRNDLLPLFTTRGLQSQLSCTPHQLPGAGTGMQLEVFEAAAPPSPTP